MEQSPQTQILEQREKLILPIYDDNKVSYEYIHSIT